MVYHYISRITTSKYHSAPDGILSKAIRSLSFPFFRRDTSTPRGQQSRARLRHTFVLCGFAAFILVCILQLAVLFALDRKYAGFEVDLPGLFLKFGPTALFSIAIALWRQTSVAIAANAPWRQMSKGWTDPDKSVLLDYVSPIMPVTMVQALRNRHWDVVLSIGVFTFMKLAMVFSTGLFSLRMSLSSTKSVVVQLNDGTPSSDIDSTNESDIFGITAEGLALQYLSVKQGLKWPIGAAPSGAYQQLLTAGNQLQPNASLTADVPAAYANLDCEAAETTFEETYIPDLLAQAYELGCIGIECDPDPYIPQLGSNSFLTPEGDPNDTTVDRSALHIRATLKSTNFASNTRFIDDPGCTDPLSYCGPDEIRPFFSQAFLEPGNDYNALVVGLYSLTAGNLSDVTVRVNNTNITAQTTRISEGRKVAWSSAIICKVEYTVEEGQLTAHTTENGLWEMDTLSEALTTGGQQHPKFTNGNLTTQVAVAGQLTSYYQPGLSQVGLASKHEAWFSLLRQQQNASDFSTFKDPQVLADRASEIFTELAPDVMAKFVPFQEKTSADATYTYNRMSLRVAETAVCLVEVSLLGSLLCLLGLVLCYRDGSASTTDMVSDILLAKDSSELCSLLVEPAESNRVELKNVIRDRKFIIENPGTRHIDVGHERSFADFVDHTSPTSALGGIVYWSTWASKKFYCISIIFFAALIVAGLEYVQLLSDRSDDRLRVRSSIGGHLDLLVTFVPATLMLILAMLVSATDFTAALLSPYLTLKKRTEYIKKVNTSLLKQLLPMAIWDEMRFRRWTVALVLLSGLLGSTLTTLSAGLYTIGLDSAGQDISVPTLDQFDMVFPSDTTSDTAKAQLTTRDFTFIQNSNGTFLVGVYDEIAYPLLDLEPDLSAFDGSTQSAQNLSVTVEVPVFRASLSCWSVPQNDLMVVYQDAMNVEGEPGFVTISSIVKVPSGCEDLGSTFASNNDTSILYGSDIQFPLFNFRERIQYAAGIWPLVERLPDVPRQQGPTYNESVVWPRRHNAPDCPTFGGVTFHRPDFNFSSVIITAFYCKELVYEISANMKFDVVSQKLDTTQAPVLNESRAKRISGRGLVGRFLNVFFYTVDTNSLLKRYTILLDNFFNAVVYGPEGVPIEELADSANSEKLINATQHIYRQYMAQFVSYLHRTNGNVSETDSNISDNSTSTSIGRRQTDQVDPGADFTQVGTKLNAKVVDRNALRVSQNRTAKWLLQGTITAMILCLLVGYRDLVAMGQLVRHNPCHIAGRVSLWAGSQLVEHLQKGQISGRQGMAIQIVVEEDEKMLKNRLAHTEVRLAWQGCEVVERDDNVRPGTDATNGSSGSKWAKMGMRLHVKEKKQEAQETSTQRKRLLIDYAEPRGGQVVV